MANHGDHSFAINLMEIDMCSNAAVKRLPIGSILQISHVDNNGQLNFTVVMAHSSLMSRKNYSLSNDKDLTFFSTEVFKFLIAIRNPFDRLKFMQPVERDFIQELKPGDPVKIPEAAFSSCAYRFRRGIIKCVNTVEEVGQGLHFFVSFLVIIFDIFQCNQ